MLPTSILIAITALIIGTALLVWSADKFVIGAASLAHNIGMSPLLIGLTVVSIGTSAPEILVSVTAALVGASGLAIGNAVGSNIANIAMVLGVTALVSPLPVKSGLVRKEIPILAIVTIGSGLLLLDFSLSRLDGVLLLLGLALTLFVLARFQPETEDSQHLIAEEEIAARLPLRFALFWFVLGLLLLIASSRVLVWGATEIAQYMGVSDLIIGLTIIAIGTSLPELAASIASALKGHHDIALGNIIGSNIFNLLAVMSIPAVIEPYGFLHELLWRDYALMTFLTAALIGSCLYINQQKKQQPRTIGRSLGALFCIIYIGYLTLLYIQA